MAYRVTIFRRDGTEMVLTGASTYDFNDAGWLVVNYPTTRLKEIFPPHEILAIRHE